MNQNAVKALAQWREDHKGEDKVIVISNPIVKSLESPNSKAMAIKAKCAECCGCTSTYLNPGWRQDIRDCTAYGCPLRSFRPFQKKDVEDSDDE